VTWTVTELPMFPLGTVLFPTMAMPLHVFEPRYRVLVRRCLDGDAELGVVLITRGSEVGGGDVRCNVGTRARILQAVELEDGRWILGLVGVERIRVHRWLPDDPYPLAEVRPFPGEPAGQWASEQRDDLERVLRRMLALKAELGVRSAPATVVLDPDPELAAWQAAVLAPLGPFDAQRVLETAPGDERVARVLAYLQDETVVLAQRVAGG
jgi:Lon protease-like protein